MTVRVCVDIDEETYVTFCWKIAAEQLTASEYLLRLVKQHLVSLAIDRATVPDSVLPRSPLASVDYQTPLAGVAYGREPDGDNVVLHVDVEGRAIPPDAVLQALTVLLREVQLRPDVCGRRARVNVALKGLKSLTKEQIDAI